MFENRKLILWALAGILLVLILLGFALLPRIVADTVNPQVTPVDYEPTEDAVRLHQTLTVADLHTDALLWDRSLTARSERGHVDLPRLIEGRIAVQGFTTVTKTPRAANIEANASDSDQITLLALAQLWPPNTWGSLLDRALFQAEKLRRVAEDSNNTLTLVDSRAGLDRVLRARDEGAQTVGAFLGVEGGHALEGDLANVDRLFGAGFRMIGLTHFFDNRLGGSAHGLDKSGLTSFGRAVVARMTELGMAIDLAHASPALIDDVLSFVSEPVIVSHTGVRKTCDITRNLDDAHLGAIARTGGVIGIGLWTEALCGDSPGDWARAVRHAVSVAGIDHVGLGSDWDGAVEVIIDPRGTVYLTDALLREGFEPGAIRKIMGGNVIRVLRETLPS
jgi:microsomal dipeptidase-like Zn-dependent dipeptidase